jgi:hypothetical protein
VGVAPVQPMFCVLLCSYCLTYCAQQMFASHCKLFEVTDDGGMWIGFLGYDTLQPCTSLPCVSEKPAAVVYCDLPLIQGKSVSPKIARCMVWLPGRLLSLKLRMYWRLRQHVHLVTYLQTIWHHFSDRDLAVPTFMFIKKDIGFVFVLVCFTCRSWTMNRVL